MSTTATDATAGGLAGQVFPGYRRPDGAVGIRNHLLVLSTVALTNRLAALVVEGNARATLVAGDWLRGLRAEDAEQQARVLEQLVAHGNVGGCLLLCHDSVSARQCQAIAERRGKPWRVQALMEAEGMADAVARGRAALAALQAEVDAQQRVDVPWGELTVALECGGSDATSALASNPAIGRFVDRLLLAGGTAIVSETAEFVGAEAVIRSRSRTPAVADRILAAMARTEARLSEDGENYRGVNPTAENLEAGLTTLVEKTMGAIAKTGSQPFEGSLAFAEQPTGRGLYFMDTPFFSPISITGMVAAGAQLTLFAVGVFNPSGNPLAPTVKVCGNPKTLTTWADSLDVDVSAVIRGTADLGAMADRVEQAVCSVLAGKETRAEAWREGQVMLSRCRSLL